MHLASQGGGHGLGGAQARPSMMPRGQDGMAAMNMARGGMMPRPLYPEDELAVSTTTAQNGTSSRVLFK